MLNDRRSPEKFDIGFPSEILDKECVVKYYTHFIMDTTNYNTITDFKLIPYRPPPTSLPSPETNSVIQGYAPKNDNTTNISTGGNDPTQTKSQKLSQITSNSSKQASTIPYTDGELLKNLSILGSISSSIQIQFNYFTSSFTTFTIVATPIASILSGPSAVTQNIPISDITGSTDITKNQHIYSITGLSQGTQYKLSLSATDYFKRTTTLVNQYATKQPPDPPTNLQIVSLTDYTADITFTPPIQIIDTYFANVYSGSRFVFSERFDVPKGAEGKRVKLPLTVSGLNFNVYYTVTFFAINSDGLSQGSVPITFLTPQIPDAPTNLFSTSQTSISIDLSFNPPLQYVQYYTFVAFDASNIQVFNQDINSQSNKYSVTGLMPNKIYDIHVYSNNSDGISPTYIQLIAETLPTLTYVSFGQITSTSIQFTNLIGIYDKIYVQRNTGSLIDGSFNISSAMTTYNDINLKPNTQYTYLLSPVNSFGFANSAYNSPYYLSKFTYASGLIGGCTNISSFYMQINFTGYYNYATIQRNFGTFMLGDKSNFPISSSPQKNVAAFVTDTGLIANTPYTYTVTIYNGDDVPNVLSINVGATTLCVVYNASFGTITQNMIQISDISGVYNKLTILRVGGIQGYVSYDIYNTTDTSYNDTNLSPNTLYTYILIPYALNTDYSRLQVIRYYLPGVQYNSLNNGTYTRPTLTDASFANTTYNSISLYKITGIFDRVRIVRTTNGIIPAATYDICSNVVSLTDISGLIPNSLNSYTLTSYNPNNLTGDIINLSIYTDASGYILPCIATGINTLKLQWTGYDSSVSIIRSGGGQFTPISAVNYPTSGTQQSLTAGNVTDSGLISNLPYTYNVTLYNGNSKPTVISTTIGNTTLPRITAATFGTITPISQLIQGISGNYTTIVINQTNITNSVTTNGIATISGNSALIGGLTPNNNYTYSLIPFNGLGVSGTTFDMSSLYTLPTLTSASYGAFTSTSLALQNMSGSYYYVKIDRYTTGVITPSYNIITVNYPENSAVDLSLNPNTQYTYYLTPYNPNNTAGATYITSGKYTDINATILSPSNITSTSLRLNLYGAYTKVAISRNIAGGNFPLNYYSSTPQTINTAYVTDISVNTNAFYIYTFRFTNGDNLTNISDISQTILTLPTITSVQYTGQSYNSLKMQLSGQYQYVKVYRIDISNNTNTIVNTIFSPDFSYNDTSLSPNYRYQYRYEPYNIYNISGTPVISSPKYTDASGKTLSFNNITFSSAQVNWVGYYTSISITRYIDNVQNDYRYITWSNTTQYSNIPDPAAQTLLIGYLRDLSIIQNITYTYRFLLYNGDGLSVSLPDIFFTNFPIITSIPSFGVVTSTSIGITNIEAICSNIRVYRYNAANNNTVSFDVSNATTIYDNSVNFTLQTIPYDASYTYKLTPLGVTGISGDTVDVPGVIYTLPILYNVSYGVIDISSIQFNLITGSYEYIQVDRYFGDITQPQISTLQQINAFRIVKGQSVYNDVGLLTDISYSYRFTPFNLSTPNIASGSFALPAIYTKPSLPSATYKTPTYTSIPIDINSSICTSITINRYKPGPILETSYDVSYAPTIYDTSFTNSIIPYDVSYTYTLTPKGRIGTYGTTYSGLGTIYTLPYLVSASFGIVTTDKIGIIVNASCTSITINRIDASYDNTTSYDVSYAPIIYDTSMNFSGSSIPPGMIYSYVLTPKNRAGIIGTPYTGLAKLYTLPAITSATYRTITSTTIPINVQGTGTSITVKRIDPNNTNTKSYDVSFANIIYDASGNFNANNYVIPYDVSYTYTLTPFNAIGISGTTYIVGTIYTIPAITSAQYKLPTYQTIPIDISSSIGLCTIVTVSRYLGGYIDANGTSTFDVSYASTIYDVSANFTNQIIPYNTAYTYKLSPKNHNGVYGADISLSTIYTLPFIVSAAYNTPTTETIPIDISSSITTCSSIIVKRLISSVFDNSFSATITSTIYDVSKNFSGNVIPYNTGYIYTITPLNAVGISGSTFTMGTIYTIPNIKPAQYKTPTYQTIPIDISSSVGLCTNVTVTRYLTNGLIDNNGIKYAIFDVSYSPTIYDVSANFTGNVIPYNNPYKYKLSPKNPNGVYGADISLGIIYTLPFIVSAAYNTPTTQTIPIDIINSNTACSNIIVNRYKSGVSDKTFTVTNATTIYDVSVNFAGNVINYDVSYTYTLTPLNAVNVSGTVYNVPGTIYTLPSITSASYGTITYNSIQITNIVGNYEYINIDRNTLDNNNNVISTLNNALQITSSNVTTIIDTSLNTNTYYSYKLNAYNGSGQMAYILTSSVCTSASGSVGTITNMSTYALITWSGIYKSVFITRSDGSNNVIGSTQYPTSGSTQQSVNGVANDYTFLPGTSYTYQINLFNNADISVNIGTLQLMPFPKLNNIGYSTITASSIYLTGITGSFSKILINRFKNNSLVYDASYTITDSSYTDTGLSANTKYTYSFTPYDAFGVPGDLFMFDNNGNGIYTLPKITNIVVDSPGTNSISFSLIDGSYNYYVVNRYVAGALQSGRQITTNSYTDSGLIPDISYTYQFIPYNSGIPSLSGSIYNVPPVGQGQIHTLPTITSASFLTPIIDTIPISVNSLSANIIVSRYNSLGVLDGSSIVTNASTIYDISGTFKNNGYIIPPDVSYTYTLTPVNYVGASGSIYTISGVLYTMPNIISTSVTAFDSSSLSLTVNGNYITLNVQTYNGNSLAQTNTFNKSSLPYIVNGLSSDTSYNFRLIPLNPSVLVTPTTYTQTSTRYTYGIINSVQMLNVNSTTLDITNIQGSYSGFLYVRTGGGTTATNTVIGGNTYLRDPSSLMPDVSYTYALTALNGDNSYNTNNVYTTQTIYTNASGTLVYVTDTSSSVFFSWQGYYNNVTVVDYNTSIPITLYSPSANVFSGRDGVLTSGNATDTGGGVGLTPNTQYKYQLYFNNNGGISTGDASFATYTLAYYSDASVNAMSETSLQFGWKGYYSDISYNIYQNAGTTALTTTTDTLSNTKPTIPSSINNGSIIKTGLTSNNLYNFDVSLVNAAGVVAGISRKSTYTLASGTSSAPTSIDSTQIQVNWTGYYTSATVTSTGGAIGTTTNIYPNSNTPQSSITGYVYNTGLTNNSTYSYTITLYNGNTIATNLTGQSAYTYPIAVTSLSASSVTDTTLTLGFTSTSTSAASLAYTTTGTNVGTITSSSNTSGSTYTASVTGLNSNSSYSINVICTNSTSTLTATSTTPATGYTLPSAPTGLSATAGTTSTSLTFVAPTGTISSYTWAGTTGLTIGTISATGTTITTIPNNQYTFALTATNSGTGKTSAASSNYTFTSSPDGSTSACDSISTTSVRVNWSGYYSSVSVTQSTDNSTFSAITAGTSNNYTSNASVTTSVTGSVVVTGLTSSTLYYFKTILTGQTSITKTLTVQNATTTSGAAITLTGSTSITAPSGYTNAYSFTGTSGSVKFSGDKACAILMVGGGGGGGAGNNLSGSGGGGAGGLLYGTYTFTGGTTYTLTIGSGGASVNNAGNTNITGNDGNQTKINNGTSDILVAPGGGGGGGNTAGNNGGCGGGGGSNNNTLKSGGTGNNGFTAGTLTSKYGNGGNDYYWPGGGGGGAGNNGNNGTISGSTVYGYGGNGYTWLDGNVYGGGGGGGNANYSNYTISGGTGGGGSGGKDGADGGSGTANTGGGGGGAVTWGRDNSTHTSGAGGSGIIIIAFVDGYRYYRIGVNHIAGGGGVLIAWANWQFFSDSAGTTRVNTPSTSDKYTLYNSSLTNPSSGATDQTQDSILGGFSSTGKYCLYVTNTSNIASDGTVSPESGCVIDFGSVVSIHSYIWYTSNDSPPRDPTSWKLYGSSDNSTWTILHAGTALANSARNARTPSTGVFSF